MNKMLLKEFLKDQTNWTKDLANKDLWSYCQINEMYSVGRQKYDWAIFKRNKNLKFYMADAYGEIPEDLISDLSETI